MEKDSGKDLLHGDLDIEMSEKIESVTSFDDLGLREELLKGKSCALLLLTHLGGQIVYLG